LGMMRKGGKAKFVVPSAIAYGPTGRQGIPPYSPLYFEVELIDFSAGPPPEEMQMPQPGK
jgi:FKBP-type peptidyl-prolyl cis-trans isomerase